MLQLTRLPVGGRVDAGAGADFRAEGVMEPFYRPFVKLWDWVEKVGGYPGQVVFVCACVIGVLGVLTWISNKR
jgi:hypothetical protein